MNNSFDIVATIVLGVGSLFAFIVGTKLNLDARKKHKSKIISQTVKFVGVVTSYNEEIYMSIGASSYHSSKHKKVEQPKPHESSALFESLYSDTLVSCN